MHRLKHSDKFVSRIYPELIKTFIHRHTLWGDLQEKRIPTLLEAMKYKIVNEFDLDDFSDFFTSSSVKNITFKPTID